MHIRRLILLAGVVIIMLTTLAILLGTAAAAAPAGAGDPVRGQYIFAASGGCGCHGVNLAGYNPGGPPFGETFTGPFGSVPSSNITSDKATGVGNWTDAQLTDAIRKGIDDGGNTLFPIMPYMSLHFMSDADVADLVAFLRTVPAVSNKVPERQLNAPVPAVPPLPPSPATAPAGGVARGKYLATSVGDCNACHTPQTPQGAPDTSKMLAGGVIAREGGTFEVGPNITTDRPTGIGYWTAQDIVTYLKEGIGPNGRTADGLMGEVVTGGFGRLGFNRLTDQDAAAIAAWLKTVPAVRYVPKAPPAGGGASAAGADSAWAAQFQAAHGHSPTAQDIADREWSLAFIAANGRPPSDADWVAHWQQTRQ